VDRDVCEIGRDYELLSWRAILRALGRGETREMLPFKVLNGRSIKFRLSWRERARREARHVVGERCAKFTCWPSSAARRAPDVRRWAAAGIAASGPSEHKPGTLNRQEIGKTPKTQLLEAMRGVIRLSGSKMAVRAQGFL
jgi:hypothetical protein